jgi:uncharacterized coiled-coil DUF342 family protein
MREYKTLRDEQNKEVRSLIESVKAEREARDRINKDINEAKERRTAIHAQLKSIYDEIRELRSNIVGSPSTDQRRMMRRVEELEWRQQTEQLSMDEERSIVEEIARIETKLVEIGEEKEKQDRISELRRLARRMKGEASDAHSKVLELSEQSQIHHQEVVRIRPELEEFKRSADTAHQNFVEWLKRVKEGEVKLKEVRDQIDEIYSKIRKHESSRRDSVRHEKREIQMAHEQERRDAAVEKLEAGKRLTFDEFILARRGVADDRKQSRRQRDREVALDDQTSAEVQEDSPKESAVSEPTAEAVSSAEAEATEEPVAQEPAADEKSGEG